MVTPSDIIAFASQFKDLDPAKIALFIEKAKLSIPEEKWGVKYDFAVILLTCHLLTLDKMASQSGGGVAGPVTSETVGDLSQSYGFFNLGGYKIDPSLAQTIYGLEFQHLQKSILLTPLVVQ